MSYIMKKNLSRKENYGNKRSVSDIKYIVIHYTANDGDSDESNAKYFHNNVVKASAHYFVDDDSVTQSVPDDYVGYSVGGAKYKDCAQTGGGKFYGIAKNANTLSIEMCDSKKDGTVMATEATMANTAELCKELMKKYNVDINHVIRHFDVNGKHCPAYFMNETAWSNFKKRLTGTVSKPVEVKPTTPISFTPYIVKVTIDNLNIRKGPGTSYAKNGVIAPGSYTIVEESNGWGKLKSGTGWIKLSYTTKA